MTPSNSKLYITAFRASTQGGLIHIPAREVRNGYQTLCGTRLVRYRFFSYFPRSSHLSPCPLCAEELPYYRQLVGKVNGIYET